MCSSIFSCHSFHFFFFFFFNDTSTTEIYTLSLHDALPIWTYSSPVPRGPRRYLRPVAESISQPIASTASGRSEEHTSELQSLRHLVCRLLLEKKKKKRNKTKERRKRASNSQNILEQMHRTE